MSLEIIKEIKVDFYNTKYINVNTKQYDTGRYISVVCFNQGAYFPIDNIYNFAFVRYRKPDELNVFNQCDITNDGCVLIEVTEQMLACAGRSYVDLVIVHNKPISPESITINEGKLLANENTSILSTMLFSVNVIGTPIDNEEIESTDEYNALNDLLIKATTDYSYVMAACKVSEDNASISETNAKISEEKSLSSELNAKESEQNASQSEINAKESENNASLSETNAKSSEENAKSSETNAIKSATDAYNSATEAYDSATSASINASESYDNAILSQSYAVGGTEARTDEDIDNARYYYIQSKAIKDGINGNFVPMGTIEFSQLSTVAKETSYTYHIKDDFVTDDTFKGGAGVSYQAGTNVYYTADGYWDCFVTTNVVEALITDDDLGNVTLEFQVV